MAEVKTSMAPSSSHRSGSIPTSGWFEVDRRGLRDLVEARGKAPSWALAEIYQNAADTGARVISVILRMHPSRRGVAELIVTDDDPDGFADLTHAFTLFAPSVKKDNPRLSGRFNFGEKEVLACCLEARVESTTGGVCFSEREGRYLLSERRPVGSQFTALIRMTREECEAARADFLQVIPREGVEVSLNGARLAPGGGRPHPGHPGDGPGRRAGAAAPEPAGDHARPLRSAPGPDGAALRTRHPGPGD
jgi:hypothetical protein